MGSQRGQGTVEWVGTLGCVALLLVALVAVGVPGRELARSIASRLLCAASLADGCGDEPALIAAYGAEVGGLVRAHVPTLVFEPGSRALPVDFRRCRSSKCGDGPAEGDVRQTDRGLPVTAFVHAIDCRTTPVEGVDCSGARTGNLYLQLWFYYADSATLRGVPVLGRRGYHRDDWESLQVRIGADGEVVQRASSHHGYNHRRGIANWGSEAGFAPLRRLAEAVGARPPGGWGPEAELLLVAGGSHAGGVGTGGRGARFVPGRRLRLIPLEPIAAIDRTEFSVSPPWRKRVWSDPEAEGTD